MRRALSITRATLVETLRAPTALLAALGLLVLVPGLTFLGGQDEGTRVWLSRTVLVEGLRLLLPLGAALGGAWLLRVAMKRGWAALPARRAEWFGGVALAGGAVLLATALLLVAGAIIAATLIGAPANAAQTQTAEVLRLAGAHDVTAMPGQRLWLHPESDDHLLFELAPANRQTARLEGLITFELALTGESAPSRDVPFEVTVVGDSTVKAEVHVLARKRVSISADVANTTAVKLTPRDRAVLVGVYATDCRLVVSREHPALSALWLALAGLAAGVLCLAAVLFVRSWSTAPTAALAGVLLFAALTFLPGFASTGPDMWRDRRRDLEQTPREDSGLRVLAAALSALPPLCPSEPFDAYINGRTVKVDAARDAALRLLAALVLLGPGALLFGRRQIN